MKKQNTSDTSIVDVIAPMVAITMEMDSIIGTLLREKFDMSLADFKVLRVILMRGNCTQLDVARFNHVTEAAVSKRVKSMITGGLLRKQESPDDKRKYHLSLTSTGSALMKKIQTVVVARTESILSDFSEDSRVATSTLLLEMLKILAAQSQNGEKSCKSQYSDLKILGNCRVN